MMVRRDTLNQIAHEIGLDRLIHSALNLKRKKTHNCSISGNAFEAFVGAIYLDRGYECSYRFIEQRVFSKQFNVEELAQKERQEKSIIIGYFSSYTKEELMAMGEQKVKEGIREKINEQMVMGQISSVYFDDYMFFE